jgi:hypothetical protein
MKESMLIILAFISLCCHEQREDETQSSTLVSRISSDTTNLLGSDTYATPFRSVPTSISVDELEERLIELLRDLEFARLERKSTPELSIPKLFKGDGYKFASETSNYSKGKGKTVSYVTYTYSTPAESLSTFIKLTESVYLDGVFKAGGGVFLIEGKIFHIIGSYSLSFALEKYLDDTVSKENIHYVICKCGGYCEVTPLQ